MAILEVKDLLDTLLSPRPDDTATAGVKAAWKKKDRKIYYLLISYTSSFAFDLVFQFFDDPCGKDAWEALTTKYERKGPVGKVDLHKELMSCTLDETEDPDAFFMRMETLQRQLKELGNDLSEDIIQSMILSKLPSTYDTLTTILEADQTLTYIALKARIREYFKRRIKDTGSSSEDTAKALAAAVLQKLVCHECGLPGHIRPDCHLRAAKKNSFGKMGGKKKGAKGPGYRSEVPTNRDSRPPRFFEGDCRRCHNPGHMERDCKLNSKDHKANTAHEKKHDIALMAAAGDESSRMELKGKHQSWIVDSGCTSHMVNSQEGLTDVQWTKGRVVVADGKTLDSVGVGCIHGAVKTQQGSTISVSFNNVIIVPSLGRNLLSVKKIVARGGKVIFSPSNAVIEINDVQVPMRSIGSLYELDYRRLSASGGVAREEEALIAQDDAQLWHRRLGHRNMEHIQQLSRMNVGVPLSVRGAKVTCDPCEVGKHTHASFPSRNGKQRSTKAMELVHMDLFGPIDAPSLGGSRYAVLFTDDFTRWRSIYFMRAKSEALSKFQIFQANMSSLVPGCKIRGLHSDNGGEFTSRKFRLYCRRQRIVRTFTGPYAPQQNGIAERSNRTVVEMARCLRIDSGLDMELWAEACSTAVYTLNRVPTSVLGGDTPFFRLMGKPAQLDHFRIFGCQAYVQVYKHKRTKMQDKAWRGMLVGYDQLNRRCYRIFDPVKRVIKRAVHVTFKEDFFPAKADQIPVTSEPTANADQGQGTNKQSGGGLPKDPAKSPLKLLPLGSNLLKTNENRGNQDSAEELHDSSGEDSESDSSSVGDGGNPPYGRGTYRPSTRDSRWCHVEGCSILGTHKAHLGVHYAYEAAEDLLEEPRSFKEAMLSPDADKWHAAADEEHQSLINNGTWTLCKKPPEANVVGSRWIFKTKRDERGKISRYKARFVAQGFSQRPGIDYGDTFAPVARAESLRLIAALVALLGWEFENMDVITAFLNAGIIEEIYIRQPEGFEQRGPNGEELVCRLNKSIYGLKQASRDWNKTLDHWMKEYGLQASVGDACVYTKTSGRDTLVILVWVDDLVIAGSSMKLINDFKAAISAKFKMKDLGELTWILGMEVKRDRSRRRIEISQQAYINLMLKRFGMSECKAVGTPAEGVLTRIVTKDGDKPDTLYMSIVGSLLYASIMTRPDISFAVQALGRHMQASGPEHMVAAKRVLRYLQGTKELGLVYEAGDISRGSKPSIVGYSDSDWAGDHDTRRSTTGYLFMLNNGGAVSWSSKLQPTVALSSAEAEYMAVCAAVQEAIHLRQLISDLGYMQDQPTVIFEDNQGCIAMSANPVFHKRTKHIDIRYHFIRERITSGDVELRYVATEYQLADLLTKALPRPRINSLRSSTLGA